MLLTDSEWFEHEMTINGLQELLVGSHLEAAKSKHTHCIVYVPDHESGKFDVYLVGKKDGLFTEYVCWVADEFQEDDELIYTAVQYVLAAFQGKNSVEKNLREFNPELLFHTYPKADHGDIYRAMEEEK